MEDNIFYINGDVDENMVKDFSEWASEQYIKKGVQKLYIHICSGGGTSIAGIEICKIIKKLQTKHKVHAYAVAALSAAFVIYMSCNKRYFSPQTEVMFHHSYISLCDGTEIKKSEARDMLRTMEKDMVLTKNVLSHINYNFDKLDENKDKFFDEKELEESLNCVKVDCWFDLLF
jgi:ATP-dependent protease ClpP protease subunit